MPLRRRISYCSGVSYSRHSRSLLTTFSLTICLHALPDSSRPLKGRRRSAAGAAGELHSQERSPLTPASNGSLHLALCVSLRRRLSLVVGLLSSCDRDLSLCEPVLEVEPQGNESLALLGDLGGKALDLRPVQQQLARSHRVVIGAISVRVRTDVALKQPCLSVFHGRIGLGEAHPALAARFHFGPTEREPRLNRFFEVVIVTSPAIVSDELHAARLAPRH